MIFTTFLVASLVMLPVRPDPRRMCGKEFSQSFDNGRVSRQNARNKLCKPVVKKLPVPAIRKPLRKVVN